MSISFAISSVMVIVLHSTLCRMVNSSTTLVCNNVCRDQGRSAVHPKLTGSRAGGGTTSVVSRKASGQAGA
eukprot:6198389-Pleurochrysis_carterae.AAC.3